MASTFVHKVWNGSLEQPVVQLLRRRHSQRVRCGPGQLRGWGFLYLAGYDYRIWESMAAYFQKETSIQAWPAHVAATAAMLGIATQAYDRWPPGAPLHLQVARDGQDVQVSWRRPETDADGTALTGIKGYIVYRATAAEGPFAPLNETPLDTTRYVDRGAASGSLHYRITAVDYRRPSNEGPPSTVVLKP